MLTKPREEKDKEFEEYAEISKWNYGNYSNSNYGTSLAIQIGKLVLYYSYNTVVAFRDREEGFFISENVWSRTTGKHLNWLESNKNNRMDYDDFRERLHEVLDKYNLTI